MADGIRVLVADDHAVVRQGLRGYLETEPGLAVVGEAASGDEAVALAASLLPDVVLMDLVMPGGGGVNAIRQIRAACPDTRVVVLTSYTDEAMALPALQAGALGYLLKDVAPAELVETIRAVHRGEARLHGAVAARLAEQLSSPPAPPDRKLAALTPRELDVLRLIAQGCSNRQISDKLWIGERTVKTHVSNLLGKLELEDRTQAAIYALRHRLAPLQDSQDE